MEFDSCGQDAHLIVIMQDEYEIHHSTKTETMILPEKGETNA
jgi:hypothetical protein